MIMYAKNLPIPPKFNFPYQQQQRYSGSFVVVSQADRQPGLSEDTIRKIEETAKKLEAAQD